MRRLALLVLIVASVAVRLWRIDAPFDDLWSWRQSDVAAIARNYFENGFHFTHPQIDWAGDQPGFVGTEFPLLPFFAALLYKVLGVHEWIGRALTIAFFVASLPFVFLLVRRAFNEIAATFALVFYSFAPLMIATSRAFMPDVPSLTCSLAGLYFFWRWLDSRPASSALWLAAAGCIALSLLLKPTSATIAAPLAALGWDRFGRRVFFEKWLWLLALVTLIPCAVWYSHANAVARDFYPHHMFGAGGIRIMSIHWYWRILLLTFISSVTPVLFVLVLIGLLMPAARTSAFHWWLLAMVIFVTIVGYGNRHEWYRLPLVPIAAAFGGAALSFFWTKRHGRIAIVAALLLFGVFSAFESVKYVAPASQPLCDLGRALREHTSPGALVVVADDGDPTALYYAHRKGWHLLERDGIYDGDPYDNEQLITDLESLRRRGATHVAFYRGTIWWLDYYRLFADELARRASLVSASADSRIYELKKKQ